MQVQDNDMFRNFGKQLGTRESYLVNGTTVKGEPVVKIDEDKDLNVSKEDPALVVKMQDNGGQWEWKPVKNIQEFKNLFTDASTEEKRENFGVWKDEKRMMGLRSPDGIPQDKEIQTMGQRWDECDLYSKDTIYDDHARQNIAWIDTYTQTDDDRVTVNVEEGKFGTKATLREPQFGGKVNYKYVTEWEYLPGIFYYNGGDYQPSETKSGTRTYPKANLH